MQLVRPCRDRFRQDLISILQERRVRCILIAARLTSLRSWEAEGIAHRS